VRTLDRTLVTVPNAEFSTIQLENFAARDRIWYHPRLGLRYETTPDQLRFVLVELRRMLYSHPKIDPDPARVRFVGFGDSSRISTSTPTSAPATTTNTWRWPKI
jgi:MscS family membrane protein